MQLFLTPRLVDFIKTWYIYLSLSCVLKCKIIRIFLKNFFIFTKGTGDWKSLLLRWYVRGETSSRQEGSERPSSPKAPQRWVECLVSDTRDVSVVLSVRGYPYRPRREFWTSPATSRRLCVRTSSTVPAGGTSPQDSGHPSTLYQSSPGVVVGVRSLPRTPQQSTNNYTWDPGWSLHVPSIEPTLTGCVPVGVG